MSEIKLYAAYDPSRAECVYPPYCGFAGPIVKHDADLILVKRAVWGTPLTPNQLSYAKRALTAQMHYSRYQLFR